MGKIISTNYSKGEKRMKWGDFLKLAEEAGIKDEDKIWFIDITNMDCDEIGFFYDKLHGGWRIS